MVRVSSKGTISVKIMIGVGKGLKGAKRMEISDNCTVFCILEHVG